MSDAAAHRNAELDAAHCVGNAADAPDPACWLSLAAAPTFALLAMATSLLDGEADRVCMPTKAGTPVSGMTAMYLVMSVFHLVPWLRRLPGRARQIADRDGDRPRLADNAAEPLGACDAGGKQGTRL